MVEYSVMLKRFRGSTRPDVELYRDESREKAIAQMKRYVDKNGFSIHDGDRWYTIAGVVLVEKEPINGAPVISTLSYYDIFNIDGSRIGGMKNVKR